MLVARPEPAPTPAQLVAHLRQRAARVATLRSDAKVDYLAEKGDRIKLTMTFLVEPPTRGLRIDAESPLGGTLASLASNGKQFELLDSRNNRFLVGEATPCNLARLIRLRLQPSDLIDIVAGGAPLLGESASATARWDGSDGGHEVLVLTGEGGMIETLKLAPRTWDVDSAEVIGPGGTVVYRLTNEGFTDEGGLRFPSRTLIEDPAHRADAKLRFRSRELNVGIPPGAFQLSPPPGIPVEMVSCAE